MDKDVHPNKHFRMRNGRSLKNLNELLNALKSIDGETFRHHVNDHKNDFANWIHHVFENEPLARDLFTKKQRTDIINVLEGHVFSGSSSTAAKSEKPKKKIKRSSKKSEKPKKNTSRNKNKDTDVMDKEIRQLFKGSRAVASTIKDVVHDMTTDELQKRFSAPKKTATQKVEVALDDKTKKKLDEISVREEKILAKEDEILRMDIEISKRLEKIQEAEDRIDNELEEIKEGTLKKHSFFSTEFIQGTMVGILLCAIIALVYIKFIAA